MKVSPSLVYLTILVGISVVRCHELDEEPAQFSKDLQAAISKAKEIVKEEKQQDRKKVQQGIDALANGSADSQLNLFAAPNAESIALAKAASIQLKTLQELITAEHVDPFRLKVSRKYLNIWKKKFMIYCPTTYDGPPCRPNSIYRSADGSCNNLDQPTWGARLCPQLREIPPMYDDGVNEPRRRGHWGLPLPSARHISNVVHSVNSKSPRNKKLTVMVMQWGQFIDHDFVSTPVLKGEKGSNIQCCGEGNSNRSQCFPITIPDNDPYFTTTKCMNLVRSAPVPNHDCNPGFREQMNQVTSYVDGSGVYGSSDAEMNSLRTMSGGLLKTSDHKMLPKNTPDKCVLEHQGDYCQKAGDARVNVVPSLGLSHTTFVRYHNKIAAELAAINPHWDDETTFQETRRIIWASIQHINYAEYLPAIFNKNTMNKYKLNVKKAFNKCYRPRVNPSISNVFAVAAFRFGHSQIPDYQASMTKSFKFEEKINIEFVYHKPHMLLVDEGKTMDGMARWLVTDETPLADSLFGNGTRNKLFMDVSGNSLDLPAINIQRGRDHGIPSYNHWRVHCKLDKATVGEDGEFVLPNHSPEETHKLEHAYRHVDDIDLFAGAMTETLLPDSSVGPTFECILGRQFKRLKFGDRFWYENPDPVIRFTPAQMKELKKESLANVLCKNFVFKTIQPNVFLVDGPGNERVECSEIPTIDLTKWKACKESRRYTDRPDYYKRYCRKRTEN